MLNFNDLNKDKTSPAAQHTASWWEFLAISVGGALLVGAGLTGLGAKALDSATDPQRAEAIAKSILDYSIPGGSKGTFGAKIGGIRVALITSTSTPPDSELFIAQIPEDEEIDKNQLPGSLGGKGSELSKEQFKAIATRMENSTAIDGRSGSGRIELSISFRGAVLTASCPPRSSVTSAFVAASGSVLSSRFRSTIRSS